jgi:hypothetical protein
MKGLLDRLFEGDERPSFDHQEVDVGLLVQLSQSQQRVHRPQGLLSEFCSPVDQGGQSDES